MCFDVQYRYSQMFTMLQIQFEKHNITIFYIYSV
jgi:hypothetical protein